MPKIEVIVTVKRNGEAKGNSYLLTPSETKGGKPRFDANESPDLFGYGSLYLKPKRDKAK